MPKAVTTALIPSFHKKPEIQISMISLDFFKKKIVVKYAENVSP